MLYFMHPVVWIIFDYKHHLHRPQKVPHFESLNRTHKAK